MRALTLAELADEAGAPLDLLEPLALDGLAAMHKREETPA